MADYPEARPTMLGKVTAAAMLTDGTTTVRLEFEFDAQGLIGSVRSDGRYREVDGAQVATPWQGRFWDYELRDGLLIPFEGQVAWLLEEGTKPYWRKHRANRVRIRSMKV